MNFMKSLVWIFGGLLASMPALGDGFGIARVSGDGLIGVTNAFEQGVVALERAAAVTGPWSVVKQAFSTGPAAELAAPVSGPASFFRARAVDVSDAWAFRPQDFIDLPAMAARFQSMDTITEFVWFQFWDPTLALLNLYAGGPDPALQEALAGEFNGIMQDGPIYDSLLFADVVLSQATQDALALAPQGPELARLNRMLLQDAYPVELAKKTNSGFANLARCYGVITTVAGAGGTPMSPMNKWNPASEGGPATNAYLSRPHIAMADRAGNIYIADKESHGIRKVTPDGRIHTVAGIDEEGRGTTSPALARTVALANPNGIWVREDGVFYILDKDNGYIRKVDTNGLCTLLADNHGFIPGGRGLWVSPDETVLYFSAATQVKRWDTTNGLAVAAGGFLELGNLTLDPWGQLVVTDRGASRVYRVAPDGSKTLIAGDGSTGNGGDGHPALETGLFQVRGIWFLPTGAYFLATDNGSQVWYVDTEGFIHLFVDGNQYTHAGDGGWFYAPGVPKVNKVRQITMDYEGSLIITENDSGYIRKVQFLPWAP